MTEAAIPIRTEAKKDRNFGFVNIEATEGIEERFKINGHIPIEVEQAKRWTGMSPNYIRRLQDKGRLKIININGTPYQKQTRGSRVKRCFCHLEWRNLVL